MDIVITVYLFLVGLCFGSFALAVADRERVKKDWVKSRSICEYCKHVLSWRDLVPVLSWISSGGRCRYCKKALSIRYPLAEIASGLLFGFSYLILEPVSYSDWFGYGLWSLGVVLMIILFIIDARSYLLPYKFLFPLMGVGLIYRLNEVTGALDAGVAVRDGALAVLLGGGLFYVLHAVSNGKWIGDGDIFLGVAMGLFLGAPLETWLAITIASMVGLLYGVVFIKAKKTSLRGAKIPFGPFLIIGLLFTFWYGTPIVDWYTQSFLGL
jgi:leader peptidase (prepilin peptidase)/N-methyltransferase